MFVFEPERSWYFPSGRSENLPGDFRFPALFSTPAAPVKYIPYIEQINLRNWNKVMHWREKSQKSLFRALLAFPKKTT